MGDIKGRDIEKLRTMASAGASAEQILLKLNILKTRAELC